MQKVVFVLIIILFSFNVFPQSSLNGNESIYESNYFQVQHINDVNFLTQSRKTNDNGFTGSFLLKLFLNQNNSRNRLISIGFRTDLFTEEAGETFYENGRDILPEYFTEISALDFSVVKFFSNNRWAFQMSSGVGLLNKKESIPGLGLWIQGGSDGRGGMHKLFDKINGNSGQSNISRDELSAFVYFSPAISHFFYVPVKSQKIPHMLVTELGVNLCTNFDALWIYWENNGRLHLFQKTVFGTIPIRFDLLGNGDFQFHKNGIKLNARIGAEMSFGKIAIGYEKTKQYGKANVAWIDFTDKEDLFRLFVKIKLNSPKEIQPLAIQ